MCSMGSVVVDGEPTSPGAVDGGPGARRCSSRPRLAPHATMARTRTAQTASLIGPLGVRARTQLLWIPGRSPVGASPTGGGKSTLRRANDHRGRHVVLAVRPDHPPHQLDQL